MRIMSNAVKSMLGKRLSYKELTKEMSPESKWVLVCPLIDSKRKIL